MLAMKLEAFKGRGNRDFLASRDFSDIVTLIDGRPELRDELRVADESVRTYVGGEVARLMEDPRFLDGLAGAMPGDAVSQERIDLVVLPVLRDLANLDG